MSGARWQRGAPAALRALDTLDEPDYVDLFTATAAEPPEPPADAWMRRVLDDVPIALRRFTLTVQRAILGLRLDGRPSPDHLMGWRIAARDENWVRLEAASWLMTGHLVLHFDDRRLSGATFVRYERPLAALVWPPVSLIHRQVGLALMRHAAATR